MTLRIADGLRSENRHALKEWGTVCDALAGGRAAVLIRKGGIRDRAPGFEALHREFFFFPTRFHEKGETPPSHVDLSLYGRVLADYPVRDLAPLRGLQDLHTVPWEDVEKRFHYGKEPGVHVLAVRAYPLERPHRIEDAGRYEGCRSWVEFPSALPVKARGPSMTDPDFGVCLGLLKTALG